MTCHVARWVRDEDRRPLRRCVVCGQPLLALREPTAADRCAACAERTEPAREAEALRTA